MGKRVYFNLWRQPKMPPERSRLPFGGTILPKIEMTLVEQVARALGGSPMPVRFVLNRNFTNTISETV